ncbi:MAG TPA: SprT family zinc-dependent metalloprotease [Gallionella sp.]|nr:SprT family zinc-dependent metalloprotease [Gallionella sp.]
MLKRLHKSAPTSSIEQRATLLAGKHITYTLRRCRRRSIGLSIDDRGLIVSVPLRASEKWLQSVLQDKAGWVVEKLEDWNTCQAAANRWQDGESIDYLGELLVLRVEQSLFASPAQRRGRELWVFALNGSEATHIEQSVFHWYRLEAERHFLQRTAHFAPLLNVAPRSVKLSEAKTQWGSCTAQGAIRLHTHLIRLPPRLIDYVVVHELAHLRELNHSPAFWQLVESVCPDYTSLRSELKAVANR